MKSDDKPAVLDGGVTSEQIAHFKAQHGAIFAIDLNDGQRAHRVYMREVDMETLAAVSKVAKTDETRAAQVLYDNCFLGGSAEVRTNARLFVAASKRLAERMEAVEAEVKNL